MVEPPHAFEYLKTLLGMAFFALVPQLVFVRVFVAIGAICKRHIGEFLKFRTVPRFLFVALDAVHVFVLPGQRKTGFVVVEFRRLFKTFCRVAVRTFLAERFLVRVRMAACAVGFHAHKRAVFIKKVAVVQHKIGLVAGAAIDRFVLSRQFKPGQIMVERLFVQPNNMKIASMMVAVALRAIFAFYLF